MASGIDTDPDFAKTFYEAEQSGLRVAIKGRIAALILVGLFMFFTRISNLTLALDYLAAIAVFSLLGIVHYRIIGTRYDASWTKYLFITLDFVILSGLIATQPLYQSADLPQSIMFRTPIFPFYFVILGMAAFSLSPRLILWSGFAGVAGWMGAFLWAVRDMPVTYDWQDIGASPSTEKFLELYFNPNFIGTGSRVQESFAFLIVALLIALVIWRVRKTVVKQLELDEQRRTISEVFAQYVPKKIADSLIEDRGLLEPVDRVATVLFLDIEGFTAMTETAGPQKTVNILNDFFEKTATCIAENNGVVTQFIGDAVMATFNLPVEDPDHQKHAIATARQLIDLVEKNSFDGTSLSIRIGICTGPVIGGSVGGGGRQTYTIYGDTVNIASRLENLNKNYGTRVLISKETIKLLEEDQFREIGTINVRGLSEPLAVYSF